MSILNCVSKAIKEFKDFSEEELIAEAQKIQKKVNELRAKSVVDPDNELQNWIELDSLRQEANQQKRKQLVALEILKNRYNDKKTAAISLDHLLSPVKSIVAWLVGLPGRYEYSVAAMQHLALNEMMSRLDYELHQIPGGFSLLKSGVLDDEIIRYHYGEQGPGGRSLNPTAIQMHDILYPILDRTRQNVNKQGGDVPNYKWFVPRIADKTLVMKNEQAHVQFLMDNLDWDEITQRYIPMVLDENEIAEFKNKFAIEGTKNMLYGRGYHIPEDGTKFVQDLYKHSKYLSRGRQFVFKNADAEIAYRKQFGGGNLSDAVRKYLTSMTHTEVLLRELGPNPQEAIRRQVMNAMDRAIAMKDTVEIKKLQKFLDNKWTSVLRWHEAQILGSIGDVENPTIAKVGRFILMIQAMSKLSTTAISSITDLAMTFQISRENGLRHFDVIDNYISNLSKTPEGRKILMNIGFLSDMEIGRMHSDIMVDGAKTGMIGKMAQTYHKWTGLSQFTDWEKTRVIMGLAKNFGDSVGIDYASTDKHFTYFKTVLKQYGIMEPEWKLLQKVSQQEFKSEDWGGIKLMEADRIMDLPDADVLAYLKEKKIPGESPELLARYKEELSRKVKNYYLGESDVAIPTPGARQKSLLRLGISPNSAMGVAISAFTQFKSFPLTIVDKNMRRLLHANNGKADVSGMAQMVISATLLGYVSMAAKQALRGQTPSPLDDPQTYVQALARGGALGVYGDFMAMKYNYYARGLAEIAGGPSIGTASFAVRKTLGPITGGSFWTLNDVQRETLNNAPFVNLWFGRTAFNYLVGYQLQEMTKPGSLRASERAVEKQGRSYFLPTPSVWVR